MQEPDKSLVNKLKEIQPPKSMKELESIMGLFNYFGRYVHRFSDKLKNMAILRNTKEKFQWNEKCNHEFEAMKDELSNEPVIIPFSLTKRSTLTTDASENAAVVEALRTCSDGMDVAVSVEHSERVALLQNFNVDRKSVV